MRKINSIAIQGVIVIFAIASFVYLISVADAIPAAVQPSKYVFVENISPTVEFKFRDGTEITPIQQFIQTGGFGITTMEATSTTAGSSVGAQPDGGERSGRSKPAFTLEKNVGGTPYLYQAADQAQKYILNPAYEFPYKFFDVTVYLIADGKTLRSFEYRECQVKNYVLTTRSDNEEGYTGKGFVYVDQFAFECDGYTPLNPAMDEIKSTKKAQLISSSDLKSTDKWEPGFSVKP